MIKVNVMKDAYGMLYEIENTMKEFIQHRMSEYYGTRWEVVAPKKEKLKPPFKKLSSRNFHELETYLRIYPCFKDLPDTVIFNLRKLYPIRNQIAHCRALTEEQLNTFNKSYEDILSIYPTPNRTPKIPQIQ